MTPEQFALLIEKLNAIATAMKSVADKIEDLGALL